MACNDAETCDRNLGCQAGIPLCGNGIVENACGEQCDAPFSEVCNNGVDDNGDGFTDCADLDCAGVIAQGCGEQCQFVPACIAILHDPATIDYASNDTERARRSRTAGFEFNGRIVPTTPVDPLVDGFIVVLSNANGEIYRAEVAPSDLERMRGSGRNRYLLNETSAALALANGGISSLHIRRRKDEGERGYGFRLRAFGDFSRATLALMTTQVYFGDDVAYLTATWRQRPGRWALYAKQYRQ